MLDRLFVGFDMNNDGLIDFDDYLMSLFVLSNKASKELKVKCNYYFFKA